MKTKSRLVFITLVSTILLSMGRNEKDSYHLPVLFFRINSLAFDLIQDSLSKYNDMDSMAIINYMAEIYEKNPQIDLTIMGCYDSKEKVKDLGLQRAKKIKELLIKKGVKESMLKIDSSEGRSTHYSTKEIDRMKDQKDREFYRRQHRIVEFLINYKKR